MKIKRICFDDESYIEDGSYPDNLRKVVDIIEHRAQGEGDKWYWDVFYSNGDVSRFFNVVSILYEKEPSTPPATAER